MTPVRSPFAPFLGAAALALLVGSAAPAHAQPSEDIPAPPPGEFAPEAESGPPPGKPPKPDAGTPAASEGPLAPSEGPAFDEEADEEFGEAPKKFVEGELASIGTVGLVPWENRFGLTLGVEQIGEVFYGAATPQLNYTTLVKDRDLSMSFGVPIRIELLDRRVDTRFDNVGRVRSQDWNELKDAARVVRFLKYGGKEQRLYLDVNQFKATSIGHGTHMKRYNPNLDFNVTKVSAELDAFGDYGGGEFYVDSITGPEVMGLLTFVKPLSLIDRENFMMRSFSLGFELFADVNAPLRNRLDESDVDDDGRRFNELQVDQKTFQVDFVPTEVVSYGVSVEMKVYDTDILDYKVYGDWSRIESGVPTDDPSSHLYEDIPTRPVDPSGITFGNLFRINSPEKVHALRIRAEYRNYEPNFLPSYFDSLYAVQRVQYPVAANPFDPSVLENRTKLQQVLGRPEGGDRVNGMYFETSWLVSHYLALAVGLELSDRFADNALFTHLEIPHIGRWQFLATYQRRNQKKVGDLFAFDFGDTDFFILKTRYGFFSWFHMNLEAITPLAIGSESIVNSAVQVNVSAELGFPY